MGLLVISTDVGGVPEVLPDVLATLAKPEVTDLFQKLDSTILRFKNKECLSREEISKIGMSKYNWKDIGEKTVNVYRFLFICLFGTIWNIFWPITIVLIWVEIEIFGTLHFKCSPIITLFIFSMTPKWPQVTLLKTFLIEFWTLWMLIKSICFIGTKVSISNTRRHCRFGRWSSHECPWSGRDSFMRCGGGTIACSRINWNISTSVKLLLWSKTKTRTIFVWPPAVR